MTGSRHQLAFRSMTPATRCRTAGGCRTDADLAIAVIAAVFLRQRGGDRRRQRPTSRTSHRAAALLLVAAVCAARVPSPAPGRGVVRQRRRCRRYGLADWPDPLLPLGAFIALATVVECCRRRTALLVWIVTAVAAALVRSLLAGDSDAVDFWVVVVVLVFGPAARRPPAQPHRLRSRSCRRVRAGRGRAGPRTEMRAAQLAERAHLARELHDVVAHHVSMIVGPGRGRRQRSRRAPGRRVAVDHRRRRSMPSPTPAVARSPSCAPSSGCCAPSRRRRADRSAARHRPDRRPHPRACPTGVADRSVDRGPRPAGCLRPSTCPPTASCRKASPTCSSTPNARRAVGVRSATSRSTSRHGQRRRPRRPAAPAPRGHGLDGLRERVVAPPRHPHRLPPPVRWIPARCLAASQPADMYDSSRRRSASTRTRDPGDRRRRSTRRPRRLPDDPRHATRHRGGR